MPRNILMLGLVICLLALSVACGSKELRKVEVDMQVAVLTFNIKNQKHTTPVDTLKEFHDDYKVTGWRWSDETLCTVSYIFTVFKGHYTTEERGRYVNDLTQEAQDRNIECIFPPV